MPTTTATELTTAAFIYKRNQEMLAKAIEGLTEEQWNERPLDSCNSALWLLGHMIWARSRALMLVGFTWTKPWIDLFARGSRPADTQQYPTSDDLLDAWLDLCALFPATLEEIPQDILAQPVQQPSPSFDGTIGGMLSFLAMHESYHVGQMVYVRRLLGGDRIVG
jgi:uncharacterized damage-inducible protein DinB